MAECLDCGKDISPNNKNGKCGNCRHDGRLGTFEELKVRFKPEEILDEKVYRELVEALGKLRPDHREQVQINRSLNQTKGFHQTQINKANFGDGNQ